MPRRAFRIARRTLSTRAPAHKLPPRVEEAVKEKLRRSIERLRRGRGGDYVFRKETSHVAEAGSDAAAMSAMEVLNNEITALRRVGFPCGVQMVTDPVPARYVTVPGGTKHEANAGVVPNPDRGTGPFHVHSWILGERGSGYHKAPTHFRFSFSSLYPREPPDVHVLSVCHHALIDDDKEVSSLFYHPANLPPKRAGSAKEDLANEKSATDADVSPSTPDKVEFVEYDLQGILVAAHAFMSKPLRIPNDIGHQQKGLDEVWRNAASMNEKRDEVIDAYLVGNAGGGPKDRRLFQKTGWPAQFFHPELREVLDAIEKDETQMESEPMSPATKLKVLSILREEAPGIYSFPMLTPEACGILITEIEHFSSEAVNLPIRRPNSMNNHGVVVNEMGMERAVDALQRTVLAKIAEALYPEQGGGCLNSHHSFVVQYKEGLDVGLDLHTDDSDVTFNVCLGKEFAGAGLTFCGVLGADVEKGAAPHRRKTCAYQHQKGRCVVHLGAHRHGADDLQTGERLNLILWNHSSTYRASEAYKWRDVPPELEPPSLECLSYTHDLDFGEYKPYPTNLKLDGEALKKHAWYPPREEQVKMK